MLQSFPPSLLSSASGLNLSQNLRLFKAGLESAMSHLRGCINEFEFDLLQG